MDGLRLLVTGKTRSGKSTSIHRFLSCALRSTWSDVLLLDGKGSELSYYAQVPRVIYCAPDQLEDWAEHLELLSTRLAERYADLTRRGLRSATEGDPRALIVIDEVQKGTRDQKYGKVIKAALTLIAEQSGALDDVLVIATQREQNSVPPNVRENCNAKLRMLGQGYFHLAIDGRPTRSGRADYLSPEQAIEIIRGDQLIEKQLGVDTLHEVLGACEAKPHRAPAKLYLGEQGSGKTYAILNHPNGHLRHIYADCGMPHRQMLLDIIEGAGASAPCKASIPDLVDIAALAIASIPNQP